MREVTVFQRRTILIALYQERRINGPSNKATMDEHVAKECTYPRAPGFDVISLIIPLALS